MNHKNWPNRLSLRAKTLAPYLSSTPSKLHHNPRDLGEDEPNPASSPCMLPYTLLPRILPFNASASAQKDWHLTSPALPPVEPQSWRFQ